MLTGLLAVLLSTKVLGKVTVGRATSRRDSGVVSICWPCLRGAGQREQFGSSGSSCEVVRWEEILFGEPACTISGLRATPISSGFTLLRQKLLRFSCGAVGAA